MNIAYVYRYRDNTDGIIKYVGIVYGETRTLEERLREHLQLDAWCNLNFTIEYITEDINTRSEAEAFESHYISLYGTDKYFNSMKIGWGTNKYLPDREKDFVVFLPNIHIRTLYKIFGCDVTQKLVYRDGDCYKYADRRKNSSIAKSDIDNKSSNCHHYYTFNKEKAYLIAKENTLQAMEKLKSDYIRNMDYYNRKLKEISMII